MMSQISGLLTLASAIALCPIFCYAQTAIPQKQDTASPTPEQRTAAPRKKAPSFLDYLRKDGAIANAGGTPDVDSKSADDCRAELAAELKGASPEVAQERVIQCLLASRPDVQPKVKRAEVETLVPGLRPKRSDGTAVLKGVLPDGFVLLPERGPSIAELAKRYPVREPIVKAAGSQENSNSQANDGNVILDARGEQPKTTDIDLKWSDYPAGALAILVATAIALMLAFGGRNRVKGENGLDALAPIGRWKRISLDDAKQHPMYGVKNWLVFFAIAVLTGHLKEYASLFGSVDGVARGAGMTFAQALFADKSIGVFITLGLFWDLATVAGIYLMLFTKHPRFRRVTVYLLLANGPMAVIFALASKPPGNAEAWVVGLIVWAISSAVWVTYLQRSRRVRVTFEQCVQVDDVSRIKDVPSGTPSAVGQDEPRLETSFAAVVPTATGFSDAAFTASRNEAPAEELWAKALNEFDGAARRPGLWARSFAESNGNELVAKAAYLRCRVTELEAEHRTVVAMNQAEEARKVKEAELAHLDNEQRAYALLPKAMCPNCDAVIPLSSEECPKCRADFGAGATWKLVPIPRI